MVVHPPMFNAGHIQARLNGLLAYTYVPTYIHLHLHIHICMTIIKEEILNFGWGRRI